jgi:hypothetical protein
MNIVYPVDITATNLLYSSIPVNADAANFGAVWRDEWEAGSYSLGDVVYKGIVLYKSLEDANTDDPEVGSVAESPSWQNIGVINRHRAFDEYVNTSSSATDEIEIIIAPNDVDYVGLFDIGADLLSLQVLNADDEVLWEYALDLLDAALDIGDWWEYYYLPYPDAKRDIVIRLAWVVSGDLGEKIRLVFTGDGDVSVGKILPGLSKDLGQTQWEPEGSAMGFSRINTDTFGRTDIIPGDPAKLLKGSLRIQAGSENYVYRTLTDTMGKKVIFNFNESGSDYDMLLVYGFIVDFRHVLKSGRKSLCSIQIQGLI